MFVLSSLISTFDISQTDLDITTVFLSEVQWDDLRYTPGSYLEPFRIEVNALSNQGQYLIWVQRSAFYTYTDFV